jgi:HD-GYP domain-containing protein (c-di-GMP phosphodiesterase class II)
MLRRAGLVHDLGRLGVSNAIWDKPGVFTPAERERVRLHPYLTERVLSASGALAPVGALAAQHHERLDGSGYPRGLTGQMLPPCARLLAAADVYQALTEPRPHRPARPADEAARELRAEVRATARRAQRRRTSTVDAGGRGVDTEFRGRRQQRQRKFGNSG